VFLISAKPINENRRYGPIKLDYEPYIKMYVDENGKLAIETNAMTKEELDDAAKAVDTKLEEKYNGSGGGPQSSDVNKQTDNGRGSGPQSSGVNQQTDNGSGIGPQSSGVNQQTDDGGNGSGSGPHSSGVNQQTDNGSGSGPQS
ncbi:hypothetical protein PMAYCL1PPCAC_04422, partial [Pristionchus mayeri]